MISCASIPALTTPLLDKLADNLANLSAQEVTPERFRIYEQQVREIVEEIGRIGLAVGLQVADPGTADFVQAGRRYRAVLRRENTYGTLFGPVTVERSLYRAGRTDSTCCPMEEATGMVAGRWVPSMAYAMSSLYAILPEEQANQALGLTMLTPPSADSIRRVAKGVGSEVGILEDDIRKVALDDLPAADRVAAVQVSLDGVHLPMRDEQSGRHFREASVGTVSLYGHEGERLTTVRIGQMPEHKKATLMERLLAESQAQIARYPHAEVICCSDGSEVHWAYMQEHFPDATHRLDYYHAVERLRTAAEAIYWTQDEAAKRFHRWADVLKQDSAGPRRIVDAMRKALVRMQNKPSWRTKQLSLQLTYFRNQRHRMDYAQAREDKRPIGSGVVEAACKTMVTQRMKSSGMSWHQEGAGQAVLNIRGLQQSNRWGKAWEVYLTNSHQVSRAAA